MSVIDAAYIDHQKRWSEHTFGPGERTWGIVDHLRKELVELQENPWDIYEWADIIILALDGAWRMGFGSQEIIDAIKHKQYINEGRKWPDWRYFKEGEAIEHIR